MKIVSYQLKSLYRIITWITIKAIKTSDCQEYAVQQQKEQLEAKTIKYLIILQVIDFAAFKTKLFLDIFKKALLHILLKPISASLLWLFKREQIITANTCKNHKTLRNFFVRKQGNR